jgi:ATP-dependent RNA helicase RhlE
MLRGADVLGCAATGTGKTAAFLLPLIHRLSATPGPGVRALILAPTRELASQIAAHLHAFDATKGVRALTVIGGASVGQQVEGLRRPPPVVIATPGRLLDHLARGSIALSGIEVLILDEADRMLDMGFWPAIRRVLAALPTQRQTLLFSATMSPAIEEIARATMRQPHLVEASPRGRPATTVEQTAYPVALASKTALLLELLARERGERVLVFTRTRRGAERLAHLLAAREHPVNRLHADRTQPQREAALRGFKDGRHRVLVATDIAARGLDVVAVSHVINYDVPQAPEDYVHRIGRTGRAGRSGHAMTLVTPGEEGAMRAIERLTGQPIARVVLPAFGGGHPVPQGGARPRTSCGSSGGAGRRSFRPRRAT